MISYYLQLLVEGASFYKYSWLRMLLFFLFPVINQYLLAENTAFWSNRLYHSKKKIWKKGIPGTNFFMIPNNVAVTWQVTEMPS